MSTPPSTATQSKFSDDMVKITEEIYGSETPTVLRALTTPVGTYYIRCNTLKVSPGELRNKLQARGLLAHLHAIIPEALGVRVQGPFDIPSVTKQITVDKPTAESVLQGANIYAPGIMKCDTLQAGDEVTVASELGEALCTGTAAMSANNILTFRKGLAVKVTRRRFEAPQFRELPEFAEGLFYPQSLAAMTTVHVLNPRQGETVVDMNCAPGGKLSHISQLMCNSGRVLGFDRNHEKIGQARAALTRLGCANVTLAIQDTRYLPVDYAALRADRILIDPPCSALGLRPKVYDFTTKTRVNNLANYQKQFIKAGSQTLKPGGTLVYSICTYSRQECEQIVDFAEDECGLTTVEQAPFLASKALPNLEPRGGLCQRFHPHLDEIGYFIAKFER